MRVLNLMFSPGGGGLEQMALYYAEALRRIRADACSVLDPASCLAEECRQRKLESITLPNHGAWDMLAAWRLRRHIVAYRPDVLLTHGNRALQLAMHARRLISARARPLLVAVAHNYRLQHMHHADAIIAITCHLALSIEAKGIPPGRVFHMPNMAEPLPPLPEERSRRTPPVIGAIGRFVEKKGFSDYITALAQLRTQGVDFRAVLAGEGPERAALEALLLRYGLEDCVSLPGWVTDKQAFYGDVDIFCLPSRYEAFGIVLLEAMQYALPIVATHTEGPAEILTHERTAYLVPAGKPDALAGTLAEVLASPDAAAQIGKQANALFEERYTIPAAAPRLREILEEVCRMPLHQQSHV